MIKTSVRISKISSECKDGESQLCLYLSSATSLLVFYCALWNAREDRQARRRSRTSIFVRGLYTGLIRNFCIVDGRFEIVAWATPSLMSHGCASQM